MIRRLAACAALAALPAAAQDLALPSGAVAAFQEVRTLDSYALPVAPFDGATVPVRRLEGRVERRTWRIPGGSATALQLLGPLRDQLLADGYTILFECEDRDCGGFDFRFGTEVVPAPDMHVNLRDFRFLAATGGADSLGLLVSASRTASYVQLIRVTPPPQGS